MPFTRLRKKLDPYEMDDLFRRQAEPFLERGFVRTGETEDENSDLENAMLRAIAWLKDNGLPQVGEVGLGRLPFLLAVPPRFVGIPQLAERARCTVLTDEMDPIPPHPAPQHCSLLVDVEAGLATQGFEPEAALAEIAACERSPLTADEGLMLVLYDPALLGLWTLFLAGSRHGNHIPYLVRDWRGAYLDWSPIMHPPHPPIIPSYARRIVAEV